MSLRDRVRGLLLMDRSRKGPLPPLRNRAEARKFVRGKGPHLPLTVRQREASRRRVTTRQKRAEQRNRAHGE